MKKSSILMVLLAIVAFVPGFAKADGFNGFEKGDWALTVSGGGAATKDFSDAQFTLNVAPSYFVTDSLEFGIRQTIAYTEGFAGSTYGFMDFNIRLENPNLVPYVGVNFGYTYGENVSDAWRLGPEAGLKYFVNTTTYLYANIQYEFDLNDGFDSGGFQYGVGLGFRF